MTLDSIALFDPHATSGAEDRAYWVAMLERIARPVLTAAAEARLKEAMPVEGKTADRPKYSHLEALGRLLCGIAPWLELNPPDGAEGELCREFCALARRAIEAATDPHSPGYLNFTQGGQPLVDAAFLAHALLRAPHPLWESLEARVQENLLAALKATRCIKPGFNNWLLFSAMIEAALHRFTNECDLMRIDYAYRQHEQWYKGDGVYGDGPEFHWDYYNSFVIQPMLLDVLATVGHLDGAWHAMQPKVVRRAERYTAILERLIAPEGTFPPLGRSLAYRCGAFQLLAQMALQHQLPDGLAPAQVRCALTAVIRRTLDAPGSFDENGWLRIGLCGAQPGLGEGYISTGSLYLCATVLLPLGLPSSDDFWAAPAMDWTARRLWAGEDAPADHALHLT